VRSDRSWPVLRRVFAEEELAVIAAEEEGETVQVGAEGVRLSHCGHRAQLRPQSAVTTSCTQLRGNRATATSIRLPLARPRAVTSN
jgi:hypothetical protein